MQCAGNGTTVLHRATSERLSAFSDAVFAVLITVLVLELRPPEQPTFKALLLLWPTWLSYAVSYLFIAIVWTNHHHLLRYATEATPRLMWFNFAHLFSMSLLPLSTAWMAVSELAPQPVAFYAAVFFLVNATYIFLIWELIDRTQAQKISPRVRRIMRVRSIATLSLFGVAAVVALRYPLVGLGICSCLPDRLSETRTTGTAESNISFGSRMMGSRSCKRLTSLNSRRAQCADQPFSTAILPWRSRRDRSVADTHRPHRRREDMSVGTAVVAHQVGWRRGPRKRLDNLTGRNLF